jgi:hypothetical protein
VQKLVNKTITPLQLTSLTPAAVTGGIPVNQLGIIPIGAYKNGAAFFDLDKLANQPLVAAERLYALDKLDARDIITATVPIGAVLATGIFTATLTVPVDELWILEQIALACPVTAVAGELISVNVRLMNWQFSDTRAGVIINSAGRTYYSADMVATSAAAIAVTTVLSAVTELGVSLRLSGGSIVTLTASSTGTPITAAKAVTLVPYGRKAKILVA